MKDYKIVLLCLTTISQLILSISMFTGDYQPQTFTSSSLQAWLFSLWIVIPLLINCIIIGSELGKNTNSHSDTEGQLKIDGDKYRKFEYL